MIVIRPSLTGLLASVDVKQQFLSSRYPSSLFGLEMDDRASDFGHKSTKRSDGECTSSSSLVFTPSQPERFIYQGE